MRFSGLYRAIWALSLAFGVCRSTGPTLAQEPAPNSWWERYYHHSKVVRLPDGRRINLLCEGAGAPTIILEAGGFYGAWSWRKVQLPLARQNRTCAYDRAGYGHSDPGPRPRDVNALVSDLEELTIAAHINGPYLLVGHSLGGPIVRMFTDRHRGDVVGLVLVDPGHQRQHERFSAVAEDYQAHAGDESVRACEQQLGGATSERVNTLDRSCVRPVPKDVPADLRPLWMRDADKAIHWRTAAEEYEAYHSIDSAQIEASQRPMGNLPLIVLTADEDSMPILPEAQRKRMRMVWMQMHDEAAALSTCGVNRLVAGSAHEIQESHPEVVLAAVRETLKRAAGPAR